MPSHDSDPPDPPALPDLYARFDAIYRDSDGSPDRVPWAHRRPCPALLTWLDRGGTDRLPPDATVVVPGCGLGEDARALAARGFRVIGFDVSPHAVRLARAATPQHAGVRYLEADLFDPPADLLGSFDLCVEIHTVQALPPDRRSSVLAALARLLRPGGLLLVIARGRPDSVALESVAGPPWELTAAELVAAADRARLAPVGPVDDFPDDNRPPVRRLRGLFAPAARVSS